MLAMLKRFGVCEGGATAIEYALIAGMIGLVIIGAVTGIGSNLVSIFTSVNAGFS